MHSAPALLTGEEFLDLPDLPAGKREPLRGELIDLPPSKFRHNLIVDRLVIRLRAAVSAAGMGGSAFQEMGYRLSPRHGLQPDASITHPDQPREDYLLGSPLLTIGIVSPSNTAEEIDIKIEDCLAFGCREVWVVYPKRNHIWVYQPGNSGTLYNTSFDSALLNGQRIDVPSLFA